MKYYAFIDNFILKPIEKKLLNQIYQSYYSKYYL